jgi:ParB-like chromosome segregation protein Spo0J
MAFQSNVAAVDLERLDLSLFPADPVPAADIVVEADRLPYDLSGPRLSPALVRVVERFGLPERPIVTVSESEDDGDYQVLAGAFWIRAAREAGLDRVPVRALELSDVSAAFLALVLNQARAADVAAQADALQLLMEHAVDEQDVVRASGLGKGRVRRLAGLLELHPTLRQALREGRLQPPLAFAASGLSEASQAELAAVYMQEGELTSAHLRSYGEPAGGEGETMDEGFVEALPAAPEPAPDQDASDAREGAAGQDAAGRARRQAEQLLRTLDEASISGEIRERVLEVVEELTRISA